jgi:hypothetical protein
VEIVATVGWGRNIGMKCKMANERERERERAREREQERKRTSG